MRGSFVYGLVVALGVVATINQVVFAQQPYYAADDADVTRRLEFAESRIQELESLLSERESMVRVQPASLHYDSVIRRLDVLETMVAAGGKAGADGKDDWTDTHGQKWKHKWGGRIMMDYVNFANQNGDSLTVAPVASDYFEFRRLRLFCSGTGYGVFDYKFQLDFEPEGSAVGDDDSGVSIKDMYVGIHDLPLLGYVRAGHFKGPFSLEELTSSKYITFMERSLPNAFATGRKVGVAAYNSTDSQYLTWAGGIYFDAIDDKDHELYDDNQGAELVGRMTWLPYYDESTDGRYMLHTGVAGRYVDDQDGSIRFRSRPEVHEGPRWIDTGALLGPSYYTLGLEAAWVHGPFSLQSEFMGTKVDSPANGDPNFYGAYLYASYFLTGENRRYKKSAAAFDRVKPLENFWIVKTPDGRCCGRGAWELAARWSYLDLSGTGNALSGTQNDMTFGVNWYMNPYTRMMFNYIHAWNSYTNNALRPETDIWAVRLQVDF
jgi:phosphate-selective porin OprO/OprP